MTVVTSARLAAKMLGDRIINEWIEARVKIHLDTLDTTKTVNGWVHADIAGLAVTPSESHPESYVVTHLRSGWFMGPATSLSDAKVRALKLGRLGGWNRSAATLLRISRNSAWRKAVRRIIARAAA